MDDASADPGQPARASTDGTAGAVGTMPPRTPAAPRGQRAGRVRKRRRRHLRRYLIAGLALAAAALAVTAGLLAVALRDSSGAAQQRTAVLAAARQEAINLTTLDRQTGRRAFAAALAGAAGSLRQQLSQGRGAFLRTLSSASVSSAGTVLDAGIVTMNSRIATVLLDVRATVRNKQTYAPETRLYHWQAGLVYSGGRWLVTSLEFL